MKQKLKNSKKSKIDEIDDPLAGDLSSFISDGGWQAVQFELKEKKDKVVSLRMSEKLFNELKKQAKAMGLDTQKFIRISLESIIRKKAG
ncbi:MAG TPA: CopG family antitoxin [Pseudobdellovibrionaceae bacterium]|nr:CopG family antitoxin [Pseudobdellovibrionaceae bacterium]